MEKQQPTLTDKMVRALALPATGNRVTFDAVVKGFGARITARGARSFILTYRTTAGRQRQLTIGSYPDWSTRQAREEAKALKQQIDRGEDPMAARQATRDAPTMAMLAEQYLDHCARYMRPRSLAECRAIVTGIIVPALGGIQVAAIVRTDVTKLHAGVSKRGLVRANRTLAVLRHMLNLATNEWGLREGVNPASAVRRNPEHPRHRYLEPEELGRLLTAIGSARNQTSANVIRLALLTGARRGELLGATWDQFNLSAGVWSKPASLTKQARLHTIPLNGPARQLLVQLREQADIENRRRAQDGLSALTHLFHGVRRSAQPQPDLRRTWDAVVKAAGLSDLRFHDLRHAFASFLASSGQNLPLIGQLLGHSQAATTQRYAHLLMDPQRAATERVGVIFTAAHGSQTSVDGVTLKQRPSRGN